MFTGIIEELGRISDIKKGIKSYRLVISADNVLENTEIGDSISVNGICLTVTDLTKSCFSADVMAETVRRTALSDIKQGSIVNLERAMPVNGRFGGHIVSGHIDGTGIISSLKREDNAIWVTVSADENILKYIVEKGSVAIDGISLTVAYVDSRCFKVSIIPHTQDKTTLTMKKSGDRVNLECDIIGKYVEKMLLNQNEKSDKKGITMDFLCEKGFI
jgi:riboflavin synthase